MPHEFLCAKCGKEMALFPMKCRHCGNRMGKPIEKLLTYNLDGIGQPVEYDEEGDHEFFIVLGGIALEHFSMKIQSDVYRLVEQDASARKIEEAQARFDSIRSTEVRKE